MRVLVIGDVHGKIGGYFDRITEFLDRHKHLADDELYSIQLGDFGFGDTYIQRENRFERSRRLDTHYHVFFGGNHDDYDEYNGVAGSLEDFGEVPFVEDSFFVRGAYSIDKDARTVGHDWWEEEELTWKESREALNKYIEMEPKYVFTHEGPQIATKKMFPTKETISTNTGKLLDEMFKAHQPDRWMYGHWHETKKKEINGTTFQCLGELETKEIINNEK